MKQFEDYRIANVKADCDGEKKSDAVKLPFAELKNWPVLGTSDMFLQLKIP